MKSVEWIIFATSQYDRMKAFYRDTLALSIVRDTPEEQFTQFKMDNCFLAIYGTRFVEKLLETPVTGIPGSTIYSFGESRDIDADYQQLAAKGVQFIQKPKTQTWGQRTAYFADPDSHIWELQQWVRK